MVGDALARCDHFATIDEHTERAVRQLRLPADRREPLREALEHLARQGWLVSKSELLRCARETTVSRRAPLESIGIPSKRRPDSLARCVRSVAEHARRHDRNARLVVADSTPIAEASKPRAVMLSLASELGIDIRWIGLEERARWGGQLAARAGAPREIVEFALLGSASSDNDIGANRNTLLLAHAGQAFVSCDDDILFELRTRPDASSGVVLSDGPASFTLHADFESAREALIGSPSCLFDLHERVLGHSVGTCVAGLDDAAVTVHSIGSTSLSSVLDGRARVVVSFAGLFGDAGASYPVHYLWAHDDIRSQLLGGAEQYRSLVEGRQLVRVPRELTLSSGRSSMTTSFALDATRIVPPFFPVLRGEDLIFGAIVGACWQDALFAHLPCALAHRPMEPRRASLDRLWDPEPAMSFYGVLLGVLRLTLPAPNLAATGEDRMRRLGRALRELSALREADLLAMIREILIENIARQVGRLEELLRTSQGSPDYWANNLGRYIAHQLQVVQNPDLPIPRELARTREPAQELKVLIDAYGRLIEAWPEIFAAARQLGPPEP